MEISPASLNPPPANLRVLPPKLPKTELPKPQNSVITPVILPPLAPEFQTVPDRILKDLIPKSRPEDLRNDLEKMIDKRVEERLSKFAYDLSITLGEIISDVRDESINFILKDILGNKR